MGKRLFAAVAATAASLLLVSCDLEMPNPGPPGQAPLVSDSPGTTGTGDPAAPPVAGAPDAGAPTGGGGGPPPPGTQPPGAPAPSQPVTHTVNVNQMQFIDAATSSTTTTIKVGDSVKWVNSDSMDHTTTADAAQWNSTLAQGATYTFTFHTAGSFPYHCNKHQSTMKGTVIVQP